MAEFLYFTLAIIIIYILYNHYFNKNRSLIWSPVVFYCLYNIYYVLMPALTSDSLGELLKGNLTDAAAYLFGCTIIHLLSFLIGFYILYPRKTFFSSFNKTIDEFNAKKIAIYLSFIAFIAYGFLRGFSINIFHNGDTVIEAGSPYNHTDAYLLNLISMFGLCSCLLLASKSKLLFPLLIVENAIFIIGGFRFRIAMLLVMIGTFYHLYPNLKKINWNLFLPIFVVFYIGMGVIEMSRSYGHGLNYDIVTSLDKNEYKPANENVAVYSFSAKVLETYDNEEKYYFESIITALMMPLPRSIFKWKPDGSYFLDVISKTNGITGAAVLESVESFICFGWFGVVCNGIFYGILAAIFWRNYLRNKESLGAILLLSTFNGLLYMMISRGYLAQIFLVSMYYVFVPFWVIRILQKIIPSLNPRIIKNQLL